MRLVVESTQAQRAVVDREREFYDEEKRSYRMLRRIIGRAVGAFDSSYDYREYYDVRGKHVLDYGCGSGTATFKALEDGASRVSAFDISEAELRTARQRAEALGVSDKVDFFVGDAHDLDLPDDSFDVIVGVAILHHLDLEAALREIHRLLKPDGRALFSEPQLANPLLKLWRFMTPGARTADERPFTVDDWETCATLFLAFEHHERELVSIPLMPLNLILPMFLQEKLRPVLRRVDGYLLRRFPWLGRYARVTILVLSESEST